MSAFPQLRRDPITDRAVLIAPERAARPGAMTASTSALPGNAEDCPLCAGREERTPPELFADRPADSKPNSAGWQLRVVPNRYPAVRGDVGEHELLVECPNHQPALEQLSHDQIRAVLAVYRSRLQAHSGRGRWLYGLLFKNHGVAAGASLAHAHSQLLVLPTVPPVVTAELPACQGDCAFCSLATRELADGRRVVGKTRRFLAVAAYAGRLPFETWLLPRHHHRLFETSTDEDIAEFAELLADTLRRLASAARGPAYNLYLHNGPWDGSPFHWHFELIPRMTGIAGFELGAGVFINAVVPEDAAARLRAS